MQKTCSLFLSKYFNCIFLGMMLVAFFNSGCTAGFQKINYGKDVCDLCKMTIMNNKFAAELVTKKGKVYKFDDLHCLITFTNSTMIEKAAVKNIFINDYSFPEKVIEVEKAYFISGENLRSPMGGNIAAFSNADSARRFQQLFIANTISWEQLYQKK